MGIFLPFAFLGSFVNIYLPEFEEAFSKAVNGLFYEKDTIFQTKNFGFPQLLSVKGNSTFFHINTQIANIFTLFFIFFTLLFICPFYGFKSLKDGSGITL